MLGYRFQTFLRDFREFQNFTGTNNDDNISGTNNADFFQMAQNGSDTCKGKGGDDIFNFGPTWNIGDRVNGGGGNDTVRISQGGVVDIGANGLTSVETVELKNDGDYTMTFIGAGLNVTDHVTVDGSALSSAHFVTVDAGNEKGRSVTLVGGDGSDHLTGGQADDELRGNKGLDFIDGEKGADTIIYTTVNQSTGVNCDHVTFSVEDDVFKVPNAVTGVDEIVRTKLNGTSDANFNSNLEDAIGSQELSGGHAVVLDVNQGDWSGQVFLIIDQNGSAGFQEGADIVINLVNSEHLGNFSADNFTI